MKRNKELEEVLTTLKVTQLSDIIDERRYSIKELRALFMHFGLPHTTVKYYEYRRTGVISDEICRRGPSGKDDVKIKGVDVKELIQNL